MRDGSCGMGSYSPSRKGGLSAHPLLPTFKSVNYLIRDPYLNSTCGILVEPASREGFVKGLTDAMLKLAQSPELRQSMGCAGRERVRQPFDWERKVDRILEISQQTIDDCPKH
ncbi:MULTISPECIES: hypothetical protein [unclassified Microcoleus]|uniref:hypothetical protein n=1 Tax=unclassified Microcoleus TaxID=2642155 RepID=UPI002FCEEFEC